MPPLTVKDFVTAKLAELPSAARLAVVFDPYADLAPGATFAVESTSPGSASRLWQVFHYDGNDLAFRQQQALSPGQSELIWVTAPPGSRREGSTRIELRSMVDVWQRAEAFIDASLPGVLRQLMPVQCPRNSPLIQKACSPSAMPGVLCRSMNSAQIQRPRTISGCAAGWKLLPQNLPSGLGRISCQ